MPHHLCLRHPGRSTLLEIDTRRADAGVLTAVNGGRDSVDHGPSGKDDIANAVAGCLTLCTAPRRSGWFLTSVDMMAGCRRNQYNSYRPATFMR